MPGGGVHPGARPMQGQSERIRPLPVTVRDEDASIGRVSPTK
jgi:hypothetical protein